MKYFVSFKFQNAYFIEGEAFSIIERESSICTWEDLLEVCEQVKRQNNDIKKVVILNWKRMESPE